MNATASTRLIALSVTLLSLTSAAWASPAPFDTKRVFVIEDATGGAVEDLLARRGRGRDDAPGDDRRGRGRGRDDAPGDDRRGRGRGADDGPGHAALDWQMGDEDLLARRGRGKDDAPGDDRRGRGRGKDDGPGHA